MVYRIARGELFPVAKTGENLRSTCGDQVSYQVYEGEALAAVFAYHIQYVCGEEIRRFWVDGIRLYGEFAAAPTMEAVLQFIQYKCRAAGCPAMHLAIDRKNLFYLELYLKYGFYVIDQMERRLPRGRISCMAVLKYPLPVSKDEAFSGYIMRSERKRAKNEYS